MQEPRVGTDFAVDSLPELDITLESPWLWEIWGCGAGRKNGKQTDQ